MTDKLKKNRSDDVIIVVKQKDGAKGLSSIGNVDSRLFTGENKLHAIMNKQTCLWTLKYEHGLIPSALQQQYTSLPILLKFVMNYFSNRNIEIVEVID